MPIFKEITAVKKRLHLKALATGGRYADAVQAAGVDPSLPHYWRRTDSTFVTAEDEAKQQAAQKLLLEGRLRQQKVGLPAR
jgi:hypothetical protein